MYVHNIRTKTISLSEEAYNRLKAAKKDGESFSDVVNWLSPGVRLEEYWGVLDDEAADGLRKAVVAGREERAGARIARSEWIAAELSHDGSEQ